MITALDTNVLFDILVPGAAHMLASKERLDRAHEEGALIISEVVYSELGGHFPSHQELDQFLAHTGIRLQPSSSDALFLAGESWRRYSSRRPSGIICPNCGNTETVRCSQCGQTVRVRQHVLADFMIGAHASKYADQLLTRDRGYYATYFPGLRLA